MTTKDLNRVGQDLFDRTYGDTGPTVQSFLRDIYPDLGALCHRIVTSSPI